MENTSEASKKTASQYYYFSSTPKELADQYRPQAIENAAVTQTAPTKGSAWNSAGTWEEINISSWAESQMNSMFVGIKPDGVEVSITEANEVDGHASLVWTRGKKIVNFEYTVELEWSGECDGVEASGTIELIDMDATSIDDFQIKWKASKSDDTHLKLKNAMKKCESVIREKVAAFCKDALLQDA
jgi:activator of HSP90 ATPase